MSTNKNPLFPMNEKERKIKFAQTLRKVMQESPKDPYDRRPTTGYVGQKCLGYIQDQNGNLLRIAPSIKDENLIGPGSYDPYKYEHFGGKAVLSRNSKRMNLVLTDYKVGPADHFGTTPSTRMGHKFGPEDKYQIPKQEKTQTPLSGELKHQPWLQPAPKPQKNRFPQTQFVQSHSRPFASKVDRELFKQLIETPGPGRYEPKRKNVPRDEEGSPIFKNRIERFQDASTYTPAPCAYDTQGHIGTGPAFSLHPLMDIPTSKRRDDATPAPGQYSVEPVKVEVERKIVARGYHSVLGDHIERRKPEKEKSPPVGAYNVVEEELTDVIPRVIRSIRRTPETSWTTVNQNPGPGAYTPKIISSKQYASLNTTAHQRKPKADRHADSNLAFTSLHNDLIIKSSNKHYNKDLEKWR